MSNKGGSCKSLNRIDIVVIAAKAGIQKASLLKSLNLGIKKKGGVAFD